MVDNRLPSKPSMAPRWQIVVLAFAASAAPYPYDADGEPRISLARLGLPGAVDAIATHARLARIGAVRFAASGAPIELSPTGSTPPLVPVIDQSADHVRVVSSTDAAAFALWVDRADLATTVVHDAVVTNERGMPLDVSLAAGTDLDVAWGADRREVTTRDALLRVHGWVRASELGTIWTGDVPRSRAQRGTPSMLAAHESVRAWPDDNAPTIAESLGALAVFEVAASGGWREIAVERDGARVHGFVHDAAIGKSMVSIGMGTLGEAIFGMSDTDETVLPAGTCLYDRAGGDVIGVHLKKRQRYIVREDSRWPSVYVQTPWGIMLVFVHATGGGRWERCPL
jgi:hypothetical protein